MLKLRLRRTGKRNQPYYRLVVAEHTAPLNGKFVAQLGHYNPRNKELVIDQDAIVGWMDKGAEPSNTVARLLEKHGLKHGQIQIHKYAERPSKKAAPAVGTSSEVAVAPANDSSEVKETAVEENTQTASEPEVTTAEAGRKSTESPESTKSPVSDK